MALNQASVHTNADLTVSGNVKLYSLGVSKVVFVINVTLPPVGGSPTLQYTLQQIDPGNNSTPYGSPSSSAIISAAGVYTIDITEIDGAMEVSWAVAGGSFPGVYATFLLSPASSGGGGGGGTVSQGTPASLSNAWPVEVTDGSHILGTSSNPIRVDPTGTTAQTVSFVEVTTLSTIADVTVTGGTNAALPSLVAGPNGIDVDADLGNSAVIRVAASNTVTASLGRRIGAGDTIRFQVQNASEIYVQTEDGSSQKVQVSQS